MDKPKNLIKIRDIKNLLIKGTNVKYQHGDFAKRLLVDGSLLLSSEEFDNDIVGSSVFSSFVGGNLRQLNNGKWGYAIVGVTERLERLNLEYGNSGDYWEATEGTYYFYSTNDNEANISVTELSDVSTIKENAVEITEENVKNGQVEHENGSKFYKYCSAMLDGKANYQASLGVLYKITVPAGAIYVVDGTVGYAIVYDSEFNYVTNNGKMENTSNEAKSYYVWKVTHSYDENANMQIKTITSKLAEEKTNATLLQVGTSETYQYDDSDDTYISMLAYNYGESTYVIENAKVYAVDPGIYTLNVKSDNPDVNAKLYLFETDDLHVHTGDLLDYESGYSTKLNLSEEKNVPIKLLNKGSSGFINRTYFK